MNQIKGLCINKKYQGVLVQVSSPGLLWEDARCFFCREKGHFRAFAPSACMSCLFDFRKITDVAGQCFRSLYGSDLVSIFFGVQGPDVYAKMRPSNAPGLLSVDKDGCGWVRLDGSARGFGVLSPEIASKSLKDYRTFFSARAKEVAKLKDKGEADEKIAVISAREAFYGLFFEALGGADETLSDTMSGGAS